MRACLKVYDAISLSLLTTIWMIYGAEGWMMEKKWGMMKSMWEKEEQGKAINFHVKPITIPLPVPMPVAMPYMKAQPMKAHPMKAK